LSSALHATVYFYNTNTYNRYTFYDV